MRSASAASAAVLLVTVASAAVFAATPPIVAVFPVEDRDGVLTAAERESVGDLIATTLVEQAGMQVVPQASVKVRLREGKRESYRDCYDQSCQVEIGREVAAQMTVATRIARIGKRCIIFLTLYDLKRATAARSTSERTACEVQAVVDAAARATPRLAAREAALFGVAAPPPAGGSWTVRVEGTAPPAVFDSQHFFQFRSGASLASSLVDVPAALDPGFGLGLEYGYEMRLTGRAVRMQFGLAAMLQRWTGGRAAGASASALHVYGTGFLRLGGAIGRVDILGGVGVGYGYLSHDDPSLTPANHTGGGMALTLDLVIQLRLSRHFAVGAFSAFGFTSDMGQTVGEADRVAPIPSLGATFGLGTTLYL